MNDVAGGGAGAFDEAAFYERLAALNPWLREPESGHEKLRRAATQARFKQGKDVWNAWANAMLAEKARLEAAGVWAADPYAARRLPTSRRRMPDHGFLSTPPGITRPRSDFTADDWPQHRQRRG